MDDSRYRMAKALLWHEVAHGIIQAFFDQCEYFVMDENGWTMAWKMDRRQ